MTFTFDIQPHNEIFTRRQLETVYSRRRRPAGRRCELEWPSPGCPLPQTGLEAGRETCLFAAHHSRRGQKKTKTKKCCLRCPPSARPDLRQLLRIRCPVCVLVRAALQSLQSLAGANSIIVSMPSVLRRPRLCFLPAISLAGVFQQSLPPLPLYKNLNAKALSSRNQPMVMSHRA